jgi:CDP-diacylglycerol---serine O-phosphatidyltransferase
MENRQRQKRFSMIRSFHLADLITIANGFCGVAAVFEAMKSLLMKDPARIYWASLLIPLAAVFDFMDGRVARWRQKASVMGRELDSLADVISFGVAPAAIAFAAGLNTTLDQWILMYFAGCGVSRLARYNITAEQLSGVEGKVKYFEGTPIPTSILPLGILLWCYSKNALFPSEIFGAHFHLTSLLFFVSGSFMISTIRIPKP